MVAPFWPRAHRSPVNRHRNRNRSDSFARRSGLLPVRQEASGRREGSVFICILFLNICNFSSHFRFPGNEIRSSHGIHFFSLNIRMRVLPLLRLHVDVRSDYWMRSRVRGRGCFVLSFNQKQHTGWHAEKLETVVPSRETERFSCTGNVIVPVLCPCVCVWKVVLLCFLR